VVTQVTKKVAASSTGSPKDSSANAETLPTPHRRPPQRREPLAGSISRASISAILREILPEETTISYSGITRWRYFFEK
jgi:hypothetical protein